MARFTENTRPLSLQCEELSVFPFEHTTQLADAHFQLQPTSPHTSFRTSSSSTSPRASIYSRLNRRDVSISGIALSDRPIRKFLVDTDMERLNPVGVGFSRRLDHPRQATNGVFPPTPRTNTSPHRWASRSNSSGSDSILSDDESTPTSPSTVGTTAPSLGDPPLPLNGVRRLPCECLFTGCEISFSVEDEEAWLAHSLSHFGDVGPPAKAICTFCDVQTGSFEDSVDPNMNWRARMWHIRGHFIEGETRLRPDFWVIKHMWKNGLISPGDYADIIQYTERPYCENLVIPGSQTNAMKRDVRVGWEIKDDLYKERRMMRKKARNSQDRPLYGALEVHQVVRATR
jgi:hypothetical protein